MRFIIHELPYEKPIASGQLRYYHQGKPTGAVEHWRLSDASHDYRFIRVDLDARSAESGRSYLYHLTVDSQNRPVQLKFRFWEKGPQIIGNVLIEDDAVIVIRDINGQRIEDVLHPESDFVFWYPSTIGLGLLAGLPEGKQIPAVALDSKPVEMEKIMAPYQTLIELSFISKETIEIMDEEIPTRQVLLSWSDQSRLLWLDHNNWPMKMERQDGLTAVESRYVKYQRFK